MNVFTDKSLLNKAKIVWKTLVVLILSLLLVAPIPALALDYNGTLQTYVSNTKVEIDGVLTSIKKLPSQSYENGKTTLAEIDSKLQKIQTDAGKNVKDFQNLSAQAQMDYQQVLDKINNLKPPQLESTQFTALIDSFKDRPGGLNAVVYHSFINHSQYRAEKEEKRREYESKIAEYKANQQYLETQKQKLANGIVLTNKISKLCNDLEKRVNLAKQKSGNVNDYADALKSFSDPDILSEITELNTFVANLTKNLTLAT